MGDWVAVAGGRAVAVLPRRSAFVRRAAGRAVIAQAVAANIDLAVAVAPLGAGVNLRRLERTLAAARASGAAAAVLLTKSDLAADLAFDAAAALGVAEGAPVVALSALTGDGVAALAELLRRGAPRCCSGPAEPASRQW